MKVISVTENGQNPIYVCEIEHVEFARFMNRYPASAKLKRGEEIDLGQGHNFAEATQEALKATEKCFRLNRKVASMIADVSNFFQMKVDQSDHAVAEQEKETDK